MLLEHLAVFICQVPYETLGWSRLLVYEHYYLWYSVAPGCVVSKIYVRISFTYLSAARNGGFFSLRTADVCATAGASYLPLRACGVHCWNWKLHCLGEGCVSWWAGLLYAEDIHFGS
jgi:hypothetical protein